MAERRRELYASSSGDRWFLGRDAVGDLIVIHEPNAASGGRVSAMLIETFLSANKHQPEHRALRELIGTLLSEDEDRTKA